MVHGLRTGYSAPLHDGYTMSTARGGRGNTAAGVVGDSKKTSRANQRRAFGRTLLRLATPPPPPAVVPVRIRQSGQHTLHQRGLERWHGPAACVRGAGSGQRAAGSGNLDTGEGSSITPSPHISPCCCHSTSAREPPADANRREGPPPSPPSPPTRWATSPQNRCTPHLSGCASADLNPAVLLNRDWHWTLPNFFDSFAP